MTRERRRTVAAAMITMLVMFTTSAARRSAAVGPVLSVSPTTIAFAPTPLGGFSYEIVTITNTGDATDFISSAAPVESPFFATFGGTCNFSVDPISGENYYIPPGSSCTFQWGFSPSRPGRQTGTGTLNFESGAELTVSFIGRGLPH